MFAPCYVSPHTDALREFNVNALHLQCRNVGKSGINTVHNIHNTTSSHERLFAGTAKLSDTQITLCKFIGFTSLPHKFTAIFKNSGRQILHYTGD